MQPSRFRLRDAAVVAGLLALLLVAGRLNGSSLQSGKPAPDRAPPSPTAAQAPPRALPRTLPVAARIPLPKSIWEMIHPPKMSPLGLVSAGIAMVRMTSSPFGLSAVSISGRD
jgi:hypothetical protein